MLFDHNNMPDYNRKKVASDKVHNKKVMKHKGKPYTHDLQQKPRSKYVSAMDSLDFNQNKRRS